MTAFEYMAKSTYIFNRWRLQMQTRLPFHLSNILMANYTLRGAASNARGNERNCLQWRSAAEPRVLHTISEPFV
jgi:hypothetical protein